MRDSYLRRAIRPSGPNFPRRANSLELAFECSAKLKLGDAVSEVLKHRLADLRAAGSVSDLVAGRPRILHRSNPEKMVLDLCDGYHVVFVPNNIERPTTETGELDWQRVSRIRIIRIGREDE